MRNNFEMFYVVLVLPCLFLFVNGCASVPFNPTYLDPEFTPALVEQIYVLPLADIRMDRSEELDEKDIEVGWALAGFKILEKKGYDLTFLNEFGADNEPSEDDLAEASPDWVRKLGTQEARYVLLIALEDLVRRKKTFGSAMGCECSGVLYDKMSGKAVWRHEAVGEMSVGGLAGMIVSGLIVRDTMGACFRQLLEQIPAKSL
jgi:hypothetical protein